jgi:hypothetical protein
VIGEIGFGDFEIVNFESDVVAADVAVCAVVAHVDQSAEANSLSPFDDDTTPSSCVSRFAKFEVCEFQSGGGRLGGSRQCFRGRYAETLYLLDKRTHLRLREFGLKSNALCEIFGMTELVYKLVGRGDVFLSVTFQPFTSVCPT